MEVPTCCSPAPLGSALTRTGRVALRAPALRRVGSGQRAPVVRSCVGCGTNLQVAAVNAWTLALRAGSTSLRKVIAIAAVGLGARAGGVRSVL